AMPRPECAPGPTPSDPVRRACRADRSAADRKALSWRRIEYAGQAVRREGAERELLQRAHAACADAGSGQRGVADRLDVLEMRQVLVDLRGLERIVADRQFAAIAAMAPFGMAVADAR